MLYLLLILVATAMMFGSQKLIDYSLDGNRCIPLQYRNMSKAFGIVLEYISYCFVLAGIAAFTINNF